MVLFDMTLIYSLAMNMLLIYWIND